MTQKEVQYAVVFSYVLLLFNGNIICIDFSVFPLFSSIPPFWLLFSLSLLFPKSLLRITVASATCENDFNP